MATVYLGLGTNLGNKRENIENAIYYISQQIGEVISISSFFESKPWGFMSENDFLNAVISVTTTISPTLLLEKTQEIEREMGRKTKTKEGGYSDRLIDIDILFYDTLVLDTPKLKIPHPLIQKRDFVLIPLAEIAPNLVHPVLQKSIREMIKTLNR
ncbi:2-amino-4-hydroxy-6-hydroxymethyldihydropteridine diphosphokinase [Paludibacter sp. 221]|uniref:2-amino-4-hydroxy-6- hydroxymethyldihydropteridine diphosphokinase n=1 Tax=Paludibacter sp. 221 TaxID=2302939 RepID=UPI0013D8C4B8|nr:2-amino-4-hydroxy-6-hydroxymethyldihydropteridine diphosphokinase [Paludibacter sp. 221]NDV45579.1 2-amino-4-hydroxy-6-hydroxymethyldihydropteridine diphosphokinase [Paludibacter sp. 221]